MNYKHFTSESVCAGHPDKVCDQISDAILDKAYQQDPYSRVAIESLVTKGQLIIAGEVTTKANLNYKSIARSVIQDLGYNKKELQFKYDTVNIHTFVHQQSSEISQGVNEGGAGDQGMMFGYACNETKQLMPAPIMISHRLTQKIDKARKENVIPYLRPDGKSEVKLLYKNNKPIATEKVVVAVPHQPQIQHSQLKEDIYKKVVTPVLKEFNFKIDKKDLIVNGTGSWIIGGPASDTGETGRKIIVDTYGGMGKHGGGCFSGKDLTKVDRSGAYACRFLAKNIVAANLADRVEVKVAYVIGKKEPIDIGIETFGTKKKSLNYIKKFSKDLLDLSVPNILKKLDLRQPIYQKTATYGHFGRDIFPWEKIVV